VSGSGEPVDGQGVGCAMGDDGARQEGAGAAARRRRGSTGSSVLTPPTGVPEVEAVVPPVSPVAPRETVVAPCVCTHAREAHEHWRRGTDCGICGPDRCSSYRRRGGALRRVLRRAVGG
jgi:hypothetical protein